MDDALDKELRQAAITASKFCTPQLHVISFHYSPPTGWMCMIQESRMVDASVGVGAKPSKALLKAMEELVERRSQEYEDQG